MNAIRHKLLNFIKHLGLYGLLFFIAIFLFSIVTSFKLINYWVNDLVDNNDWATHVNNKVENDYISNFWGKMQFVNFNGVLKNLLNQQEMNGVVKLNNGYLFTPIASCPKEDLQEYANEVINLNEYLKIKNIPFLYATTPYTCSKYDPQLPIGINDFGNENIDYFLDTLKNNGVCTMDFRELMYEDGINQYDMMYKTDHHWTTQAGFYAYKKIADYLQDQLNCNIDETVQNINNYTITTYPKWHLGSRGQRTGIFFAGIDDFELILPNFKTSIQRDNIHGTVQSLIYDMASLQCKDYTSRYTYDRVLDNSLLNYKNSLSLNNKKILIMTDSMGKAVNPFLIISFSEVMTLSNRDSAALTKELINSFKPDAVILLYYPEQIKETSFEFSFGLTEERQLNEYFQLLQNNNYNIVMEIINSDIYKTSECMSALKALGIDIASVTDKTDFILIKEGGKDVSLLESSHLSGFYSNTVLGSFSIYYDDSGKRYGIYLDNEETMVVSSDDNKKIDIRILVMDNNTSKVLDYVSFNCKLERHPEEILLTTLKTYRDE